MIGSSLLSSHRLDTCCGVKQEQTSVNVLEMWIPSTAQEKLYYDKLFQIADGLHGVGRLAGQPAVAFLAKSDLDFPTLKKVKFRSVFPFLVKSPNVELSRVLVHPPGKGVTLVGRCLSFPESGCYHDIPTQ